MTTSRCGYVAIIGRPNVGKSTLLNYLLAKKISITTPKPQTTRSQILGIKTIGADQIVFIDTPGIHDSQERAMNRYMNRLATAVIGDADVIVFLVEANRWTKEDNFTLTKLQNAKVPVILAINKVDKVKDKQLLLPFIIKLKEKFAFEDIIPLSAKDGDNVSELEKIILKFIPEGPHLFLDDQVTDKPMSFQIAELIREKVIRSTEQEIPFSTTVSIEDVVDKEKFYEVSAIIWVERAGQKPIIIGKDGERLKKIGIQARKDIQVLLGKKVFLRLWVKIKDKWTDDEKALKSLGFQ